MAHFAQLDEDNIVINVVTVNNDVLIDGDGVEQESLGITFLQNLYGAETIWKQTSFNTLFNQHFADRDVLSDDQTKAFRGNFAGVGDTYDPVNNIFYGPRPEGCDSWTFNISNAKWEAPITYPSIKDDGADPNVWYYHIYWDEAAYQADNTTGWKANRTNDETDPPTEYGWDGSSWNVIT